MSFHAQVLTPSSTLFAGEVSGLVIPGVEGVFGVRRGHAPFITPIDIGVVRVQMDFEERYFVVAHGMVEVTPEGVVLLASHAAVATDEFNAEQKLIEMRQTVLQPLPAVLQT